MDHYQILGTSPEKDSAEAEAKQRKLEDAQFAVKMALKGEFDLAIPNTPVQEKPHSETPSSEIIPVNPKHVRLLEEARLNVEAAYNQAA